MTIPPPTGSSPQPTSAAPPDRAAPPGARAAPPDMTDPGGTAQIGRLRQLHVSVQSLQSALARIRSGATTPKVYAPFLQQIDEDVASLLSQIHIDPSKESADSLQRISNLWIQVRINPLMTDPEDDMPAQDQLHNLDLLDDLCEKLIFQTGYLTIPMRVKDWLDRGHTGYYIPFHAVFNDELPRVEDRTRVLRYLAWAPDSLENGVVDLASGLVYRYTRSWWGQSFSLAGLVVAFGVALWIIIAAANLGTQWFGATWPLKAADAPVLVGGWVAILAGVVFHVIVAMTKRAKAESELPPVLSLWDIPRVVNARLGDLLSKLLFTLIVLFGLAFTGGIGQVQPLQAFLAGYSLDSLVDLFGATVEQRAAAQVNAIRQQLSPRDQSGGDAA